MSSFDKCFNWVLDYFQCISEDDFENIALLFFIFIDFFYMIFNNCIGTETETKFFLFTLHLILLVAFMLSMKYYTKIQKLFHGLKSKRIKEIYLIAWSILNILYGTKIESTIIPYVSFVMNFNNLEIRSLKSFSLTNIHFCISFLFIILRGRNLEQIIFYILCKFSYIMYVLLFSKYQTFNNQRKLNKEIKNLELHIYSLEIPAFMLWKKEIIFYNCYYGLLIEHKELDTPNSIFDFQIEKSKINLKEKINLFQNDSCQTKLEKIPIICQEKASGFREYLINLKKVYFRELLNTEPIIILSIQREEKSPEAKKSSLIKHFNNLILYSASHEFKSQINIIKGNLKIIEKKYHQEEILIVFCSLFSLDSNFNLLRDYVEIQNETFIPKNETFSIKKFIRKLSKLAKILAKSKNIFIKESGIESTPINLVADKKRLLCCLNHIVSNAVKYTNEGKIEITIEFHKSIKLFRVIVSDTGLGMNELFLETIENSKSILDSPFLGSRSRISNFTNSKLTGMGFKLIKAVIDSLKGKIYIDSKLNVGTNVIIEVPAEIDPNFEGLIEDESCVTYYPKIDGSNIYNKLIPYNRGKTNSINLNIPPKIVVSQSSLVTPKLRRMGTQFQLINRTILVIDDMEYNRKVIRSMLESYTSYIIEEGANGKEAIDLVKKYTIRRSEILIFLDIDMPIMNGIEAAKIIKQSIKLSKIMIVAVTSFDNEEMKNECLQAGIDEFVPKPISNKKIKEIVDKFFIKKNIALSFKKS